MLVECWTMFGSGRIRQPLAVLVKETPRFHKFPCSCDGNLYISVYTFTSTRSLSVVGLQNLV